MSRMRKTAVVLIGPQLRTIKVATREENRTIPIYSDNIAKTRILRGAIGLYEVCERGSRDFMRRA